MLEGAAIINEWGFGDVLADLSTIVDSMKMSGYTLSFNDHSLRKLHQYLKRSFEQLSGLLEPNMNREFDFQQVQQNASRSSDKRKFLLKKSQLSYYFPDT
jgi:hypothetical protein